MADVSLEQFEALERWIKEQFAGLGRESFANQNARNELLKRIDDLEDSKRHNVEWAGGLMSRLADYENRIKKLEDTPLVFKSSFVPTGDADTGLVKKTNSKLEQLENRLTALEQTKPVTIKNYPSLKSWKWW